MKNMREHQAEWDRLLEEERQAQAREMSGTVWASLNTMFGGPPPGAKGATTAAGVEDRQVEGAKAGQAEDAKLQKA